MESLRPAGPLTGRHVSIEPLEERHREGLREAVSEAPQTFRFMAIQWIPFDEWFDEALVSADDVPFALVADGREVGSTRFLTISLPNRRAEIGWTWLRRSVWGTGVNIETKLLLLEHAFERRGLQRVEFKTDARNLRSRGALLALGAKFEGISPKHMVIPGGWRDTAWYAIVDDDWPDVKQRLLRRLEPGEARPAA